MLDFFIRKNILSYLIVVTLIATGLYSLALIPRESSPEVQIPIGIIMTTLPGAPAIEIESLVTNELERGLIGNIDNARKVTSTSRDGVSTIIVEYSSGTDLNQALNDLRNELDTLRAKLPDEASEPRVSEINFVDQPIMTFAVAGDLPPVAFTEISRELVRQIEQLPSITRVETSGVSQPEIGVVVDIARLQLYDLTLNDVTSAISSANRVLPIGRIENDGVLYNVVMEGKPKYAEDIAQIPISVRAGQPVYVGDVAQVSGQLSTLDRFSRLSVNSQTSANAISFSVFKQRGGDITRITGNVNEKLDELRNDGELLTGLEVITLLDSGADIESDLRNLTRSGLQTVTLVILALVIVIGWREALIAGLAIPLSFLVAFIGLYASGNTINFLSLFSLILGIGVLVDSSIVMVEGINRRMKDDPNIDKKEAAIQTIREYYKPIIAGTLTTVAMFVGLFVVGGVTGEFIKSIPFTLIFLLFASLFVALAIIPVISASLLRRRSNTKMEKLQVELSHQLEHRYRSWLSKLVGNNKKERVFLWGIRIALIISLTLPVTGLVKVVFFDDIDIDFIFVDIELPTGSDTTLTNIYLNQVEEVLYETPDIKSFLATVGSGNQFTGGGAGSNLASILINLDPDRDRLSADVVEDLRQRLSHITEIRISVDQPQAGPPTGAPIGLRFIGDDLDELTDLANQTTELLRSIEGTTDVRTDASDNVEFVLDIDNELMASFGLNSQLVSATLRGAVFGSEATTITSLENEIPVIVTLDLEGMGQTKAGSVKSLYPEQLLALDFATPTGELIPLSTFASISLRDSQNRIEHENGKRVVSVNSGVRSGANVREIQSELERRVNEELVVPSSIEIRTGGETEEADQAFQELFLALLIGIALVLAILVIQFNSLLHTRYVLGILPYSLIGIMSGFAITGSSISFPSIMGFIALSGIVINNAILLIDVMNNDRRRNPDKTIREVVLDGASKRVRPILLTTATTVIGMIPLLFAGEIWAPLAYAVMFGLLFSVIITLALVPVMYYRRPGKLT